WQPVDTTRVYTKLATGGGSLYASTSGMTDTLYRINGVGNRQVVWYRDSTNFTSLDGIDSVLYSGVFNSWTGGGRIYHFSTASNTIIDSTFVAYPKGIVKDNSGVFWVAD